MSAPATVKTPVERPMRRPGESQQERTRSDLQDRLDKTTRVLRGLGAALLLASASSFLVQRWEAGNDLVRFGSLLAHSFVLVGAALFCGGKLSESRSARLFLWTTLALVPVQFGVLGGLVYSQMSLDAQSLSLPSYATWQAPHISGALLAVVGALLTVVPTTWLSARVLVPGKQRIVTLSYVGVSALLLVPLRNADAVSALVAIGTLFSLVAERRWLSQKSAFRTWEGRLVRGLLWAPLLMMIARTATFYATTDLFVGLLIASGAACGWVLCGAVQDHASRQAGQWLSALAGAYGCVFTLGSGGAFEHFGPLVFLAVPAVFLAAAALANHSRAGFERAATFTALLACVGAVSWQPTLLEGALCIIIGVACIGGSLLMGRTWMAALSGLVTLGALAAVFERAVGFERVANWGTLSVLGVAVVLGAALLERRRDQVIRWVSSRQIQDKSGHSPDPKVGPAQRALPSFSAAVDCSPPLTAERV